MGGGAHVGLGLARRAVRNHVTCWSWRRRVLLQGFSVLVRGVNRGRGGIAAQHERLVVLVVSQTVFVVPGAVAPNPGRRLAGGQNGVVGNGQFLGRRRSVRRAHGDLIHEDAARLRCGGDDGRVRLVQVLLAGRSTQRAVPQLGQQAGRVLPPAGAAQHGAHEGGVFAVPECVALLQLADAVLQPSKEVSAEHHVSEGGLTVDGNAVTDCAPLHAVLAFNALLEMGIIKHGIRQPSDVRIWGT